MKKVFYSDLRPEEFLESIKASPIAYLPLGTLEWHGYHMPLGADSLQSEGVMALIAKEVGGVVFPPLFLGPDISNDKGHYGMDICSFEEGHSAQLPGSCYFVREELFGAILKTVVEDAKRAGFRLMVVHGHGPSINYVNEHKKEFALPLYTLFDIAYSGKEGIQTDHAAANETSITMALRPELVDLERINEYGYPLASWGEDPRKGASKERGEELIRSNVEKAAESLRNILKETEPAEEKAIRFDHIKDLLEK